MRLLIIGATGGTGRELVRQALDAGHAVTAFARTPTQLPDHAQLRPLPGDALDAAAVAAAVRDHDAVLCALGRPAGKAGTVRSQGTRNLVAAMREAQVRRLVCLSTIGIGETRAALPPRYRYAIVPLLLRSTFAEHARQEQAVRASDLDWTIVRAGALTDGARSGAYRHGFPPDDRRIAFEVSRADVAEFMLAQLAGDRYLREAPSVSY